MGAEKPKPEKFTPFIGKHCETTALKRVLDYHGLSVSEEMLLGLGGGAGFIYWYMKLMPAPFVGGRNGKVAEFAVAAGERLGAEVTVIETASPRKGYDESGHCSIAASRQWSIWIWPIYLISPCRSRLISVVIPVLSSGWMRREIRLISTTAVGTR